MNDIDFERELKQRLNHEIDTELSARRTPPPFEIPSRAQRIRPWLVPLAAAAAVIAVVAGTAGATQLLGQSHPVSPASSGPATSTPTSQSPSTATSNSPSSTTSTSASEPRSVPPTTSGAAVPAPPNTQQLQDASIWLPAGWGAVDSGQTPNPAALSDTKWCLGPAGPPGGGVTCLAYLERSVQRPNTGGGYDSDVPGGMPNLSSFLCGDSVQPSVSVAESGDRNFGGRTADFRVFRWSCSGEPAHTFVKYLVPAGPAFELSATSADSELQAQMALIAQNSKLPSQTSAVRYYDHGYVRSLTAVAGGYRLAIDRVVPGPNGPINNNPQTYVYFCPADDWKVSIDHPGVGDVADLFTDGNQVILTYKVAASQNR